MNLKWNVFYYNINKREITTLNIFDHWRFNENVQKSLKKFKDKDEFSEELRRDLQYYFWCKSEYEIIISPWCGRRSDDEDIKVDIYTQVMNNWDIFLDYVWNSKKRRKAKNEIACNKRYILEKIEEFNRHNVIYEDIEGAVCYLAYFKTGERGWFLYETDDYGFVSAHRVHTTVVKSVEYVGDCVIVETKNTRFTFKLMK